MTLNRNIKTVIAPAERITNPRNLKFFAKGKVVSIVKTGIARANITEGTTDVALYRSDLNTPVYDRLTIGDSAATYIDVEGNIIPQPQISIDTVLMEVSQTRNIVRTALQGRNGTIKQWVSDGDFEVRVTGKIVDPDNNYPLQQVKDLKELISIPDAVKIRSDFLNQIFGIQNVVLTEPSWAQTEGVRNEQAFSFLMIEDKPLEIVVANV